MTATIQRLSKKVCLLGDMSVGKTSLVRRFVEDRFDDKYLSTLGVKISRKVIDVGTDNDYVELHLLIWDIAGGLNDAAINLKTSHLRGAAGTVLVCDRTRPKTLYDLKRYAQRMGSISPNSVFVVAANKSDLLAEKSVGVHEVAQVASELGAIYFTTSARTGEGVEDLFTTLAHGIYSNQMEE